MCIRDSRQSLQEGGAIFRSTTDSEVIACDIARERTHTSCVEDAILQTARKLKGGYALVIISPRKLIGVRDPLGLKPLCLSLIHISSRFEQPSQRSCGNSFSKTGHNAAGHKYIFYAHALLLAALQQHFLLSVCRS